jgi:hypothetical protein
VQEDLLDSYACYRQATAGSKTGRPRRGRTWEFVPHATVPTKTVDAITEAREQRAEMQSDLTRRLAHGGQVAEREFMCNDAR